MDLLWRKRALERQHERLQRAQERAQDALAWERLRKIWDAENEEYARQDRESPGPHAPLDADAKFS